MGKARRETEREAGEGEGEMGYPRLNSMYDISVLFLYVWIYKEMYESKERK